MPFFFPTRTTGLLMSFNNAGRGVSCITIMAAVCRALFRERIILRRHPGLVVITSALIAATLSIAFLAGCGSDTAQARQYIDAAKEKSVKVAQNVQKLNQKGVDLTNFFNAIQNITPDTGAAMKQFLNEAVALQEAINNAAQDTRTEYEKILALGDAADYKKYAEIQIKILDLINQRSVLIKQFAAIYNGVVDYVLSGQPDTPEYEASIQAQAQPIMDERIKLSQQIEQLNQQAADLAKKLNIS